MFNSVKEKAWDEGSQWGIDTFAFIMEMRMIMGHNLQEAYDITKQIMVNHVNLESRLAAFKESHVQS